MSDLEYIQSQIDQKIDETITRLKVEAVANMVIKLNKEHNLNNVAIELSVNEDRMRSNYAYQPKNCFDNTFTAQIHDQKHNTLVDLKEEFKDVFMFSLNNRPTKFHMYVSFNMDKYEGNNLINELVNQGFFHEAGDTKKPETLFAEVLIRLSAKGEYISGYSYQKPEPAYAPSGNDRSTQKLHDSLMATLEPKQQRQVSKIPSYK